MNSIRREYHCVILRKKDVGDFDRFYIAYSKECGRCMFRARGVRKQTSKLSSFLIPFAPLRCELLGNSSYPTLVGAEFISECRQPALWREDIVNIAFAEAVSEFLLNMIQDEEPDEQLYMWYVSSLAILFESFIVSKNQFEKHRSLLLYAFLCGLSTLLGYGLELSCCVQCGEALSPNEKQYFCSSLHGGTVCPMCVDSAGLCAPLTINEVKVLRLLLEGNFTSLMNLKLPLEWGNVRMFLDSYFQSISEKPFETLRQYWDYEEI